ncbi:MAG: hypothetical protein M1368_10300 [Thaumarchaeota archaeon]|nr:hypothetical protein [Nitrososphaerota archaeon]
MAGKHALAGILVALLLFGFGLLETSSTTPVIITLCFATTGIAILGWLGIVAHESMNRTKS